MGGKSPTLADLKRLIFGVGVNSSGLMRFSISGYALFSDDSNIILSFDSEICGESVFCFKGGGNFD